SLHRAIYRVQGGADPGAEGAAGEDPGGDAHPFLAAGAHGRGRAAQAPAAAADVQLRRIDPSRRYPGTDRGGWRAVNGSCGRGRSQSCHSREGGNPITQNWVSAFAGTTATVIPRAAMIHVLPAALGP